MLIVSLPANKTFYFITTIKRLKCHDKRNPGVGMAHKNESLTKAPAA